ncbi:YdbC family protein [Halalkalibacter okhensis]|uniref:Seryl-tRNA synthetase n=1 Tax=Halalkalibacter okhensis TaxID=333138 RepID=A0A0B0IIW2_9BACI|nr:YdbC family protein [Halalkalibacter okhensis]KHF39989.1 seryl-tRNA synthetase [Halalkalibacter okhensis]
MAEIKFEIAETIAVLSEGSKGWKKELNLISWNGREPKYDIRDWAPDHSKMGKGVTLSEEEVKILVQSLTKGR